MKNILIDTKSIAVKHHKYHNINIFTHSTVQNFSVLTSTTWEITPVISKDFHKTMTLNISITGIILQYSIILFFIKIHNIDIPGCFISRSEQHINFHIGSITGGTIMVQLLKSYLYHFLKVLTYSKKSHPSN